MIVYLVLPELHPRFKRSFSTFSAPTLWGLFLEINSEPQQLRPCPLLGNEEYSVIKKLEKVYNLDSHSTLFWFDFFVHVEGLAVRGEIQPLLKSRRIC